MSAFQKTASVVAQTGTVALALLASVRYLPWEICRQERTSASSSSAVTGASSAGTSARASAVASVRASAVTSAGASTVASAGTPGAGSARPSPAHTSGRRPARSPGEVSGAGLWGVAVAGSAAGPSRAAPHTAEETAVRANVRVRIVGDGPSSRPERPVRPLLCRHGFAGAPSPAAGRAVRGDAAYGPPGRPFCETFEDSENSENIRNSGNSGKLPRGTASHGGPMRPGQLLPPGWTTMAEPPPRRTFSAAASQRPSGSRCTAVAAPISGFCRKAWPSASSRPRTGLFQSPGSISVVAAFRWLARGRRAPRRAATRGRGGRSGTGARS